MEGFVYPPDEKCSSHECCCKCKFQFKVYPFKPDHFHHVGGYMCIGLWSCSGNEERKKTGKLCSHFKDGHGICECFEKEI